MTSSISAAALAEVEQVVQHALETRDDARLHVLGYGEISLVLGWPAEDPVLACKRLPLFATVDAADAYGALIAEYVDRLRERGVDVLPTEWHLTPAAAGGVAAYVVQPALPEATLATRVLAADPSSAPRVIEVIVEAVDRVVGPDLGLDAQVSNWVWAEGALRYVDVTTPMLCDPDGRTRMDLRLLTSPLPAFTRPAVRRFVAPAIVADYHDRRKVIVDLVGNLLKERLGSVLPTAIEVANRHVTPALDRAEIDRWYRGNARMWEVMLRLRRADRWWQGSVRRRTYPFLLPRPVDR